MAKFHFVASLKDKVPIRKRTKDYPSLFSSEFQQPVLKVFQYQSVKATFYCGDVLSFLDLLKTEKIPVHLVITSPPYNTGLVYNNYNDDLSWDDYLNWLVEVFQEINEVLVPGARVVLNVPYLVKFGRGQRKLVQRDYEEVLEKAGLSVIDLIVWVKARDEKEAKGVAGRSTAWGTWCSPKKPAIRPLHEILLIASKEGKFEVSEDSVDLTEEEFKNWTTSTWFIPSVSHKIHPAVFPEELVRRAIKLFTGKRQNVFDPFAGIGTTLKVSLKLERNSFGSEIDPLYFNQGVKEIESELSLVKVR